MGSLSASARLPASDLAALPPDCERSGDAERFSIS